MRDLIRWLAGQEAVARVEVAPGRLTTRVLAQ
jgi:hypothetical protein